MVSPLMLISVKLMAVGLVGFAFIFLVFKIMKKIAEKKSDSRTSLVVASSLFITCFVVTTACMIYTAMLLFEMAKYAFS